MIYNGIEGTLAFQRSAFNAFESFKLSTSAILGGGNLYCVNKYFYIYITSLELSFSLFSASLFLYYGIWYVFPLL